MGMMSVGAYRRIGEMLATPARFATVAAFTALAAILATGMAASIPASAGEAWDDLKPDVYGDRPILDGAGIVSLDAPMRPDNQSEVPISVTANLPDGRTVRRLTIIIDNNPAPVAADFTLHQKRTTFALAGKFRFNRATDVRVVVEASDGQLYMASRHVKFAGGQAACSAPPNGDPEEIAASMGQMSLTHLTGAEAAPHPRGRFNIGALATAAASRDTATSSLRRLARLDIRHPNHTGMVLDQITLLYVPLRMITDLEVGEGGEPVMSMKGSISISQDPSFTFDYRPNGAAEMTVELRDSDNAVWTKSFAIGPAS